MDIGMKKCGRCQRIKKYEEFNKNKRSKDGYQDRCKQCQSDVAKANREKSREYVRKSRAKKKALKKYPGRPIRKKKEETPSPTLTQVASRDLWHNKDNVVYCRGEAIAMATDPKWAREIVEARNSSTDVTQTVALLKQIKNVLVKDLQQENDRLREELARLQVLKSPKQEIPAQKDGNGHRKRKLKEDELYFVNGEKLIHLLNIEGISHTALASMLETSQPTVSRWIRNENKCRMGMIAKIAELLEVDVAELVLKEPH